MEKIIKKSVVFILSYSLNRFLEIDLFQLRKQTHFRLVAIVDAKWKCIFIRHEALFDHVYYAHMDYHHTCFVESFSPKVKSIVALEYQRNANIKLFSFYEGDVEATAKLRKQFGIPGLSYQDAVLFRNKLKMKKIVKSHQMLVPTGLPLDFTLTCKQLFTHLVATLKLPFIVKPIQLGGGLGVVKISSYKQFKLFYSQHIPTDYMAEENIDGELFHLDLVVHQQSIKWFGCSQYNVPPIHFIHGIPMGSLPLLPKHAMYETLSLYASKLQKSLKFDSGILHIEVFISHDKHIYFLEAAARPAGGLIVRTYENMFGYQLVQADLAYQLGLGYLPEKRKNSYYFWLYFPDGYDILKKVSQLKQYVNVEIQKAPDAKHKIPSSVIGQFSYALVCSDDYARLKSAFLSLSHDK